MSLPDLTAAQLAALRELKPDRWTTIGVKPLMRPTITALARMGLCCLADKLKRQVDPQTAAWAAQFAKSTKQGERIKTIPRIRRR